MKKNCLLFSLALVFLLTSCTSKQDQADYNHLVHLDSLLVSSPQSVVDSLKSINPSSFSNYNHGYFLLLDVISKDKTYYDFKSDSLIQLAVKRLSPKKKQLPNNYARGLMYSGIVRLRMGLNDSTVYRPLKEALNVFDKMNIKDYNNLYLCNYYIGSLLFDQTKDMRRCSKYYNKALDFSKLTGRIDYQFTIYIELFWVSMKDDDFNQAKIYLTLLDKLSKTNHDYKITLDYLSTIYFHYTNSLDKSTKKCRDVLFDIQEENDYHNVISAVYSRIADNYIKKNDLDSALNYMEKAIANLQDTTYFFNYYYYHNLGEISEQSHLWQKSALAYKKAYDLKSKAVNKELDKNVLELEKKYDLTQAENEALHFRSRAILLGFLSVILIILLISFTIIIRQKNRQTALKIKLTEQKNTFLEQEKHKMERNLIEKEFVLPIYQQISQRNASLKGLLSDLKTNVYITKNQQLSEMISSIYADFVSVSEIKPDKFLSNEKFCELTGLDQASSLMLNESDKMLIVFISLELDNRQIAVLFNTSESSIRGRKTKLRSKLEELHIKNILI